MSEKTNLYKNIGILVVLAVGLGAIVWSNQQHMKESNNEMKDPYIWLEDVEGERALAWVEEQNARTLPILEGDSRYSEILEEAADIFNASDRIPYASIKDGYAYNFWQDETNVRGLMRRATLASYQTDAPEWETVFDLDAIATAEQENWVYKGRDCLGTRCLLRLSRGGGDAVVVREFDLTTKDFVVGGFELSEAKLSAAWVDTDTLIVGSDFGDGSVTTSGYARTIRIWKRGTNIADAPQIFEIPEAEMGVFASYEIRPEGHYTFINQVPKFFTGHTWHVADDGTSTKLPFPEDADYRGMFKGYAMAMMRTDWVVDGATFPAGSLIGISLPHVIATGDTGTIETIYAPREGETIEGVSTTKDNVYVSILNNVTGSLKALAHSGGGWMVRNVSLPENGSLRIVDADDHSNVAFVNYESFLTPDSLYVLDGAAAPRLIKSLPARFDATSLVTEQKWATSADGTQIPYFIVHANDMPMDGTTPTLLYGYGGFEVSLDPSYVDPPALSWLKRGGAYAVANIRGGGEFGPKWHQAALLENRQRAYDDFIAVSEDLIATGVTTPRRLGIRGGSNGGLLMGAMFTQRPELYNAVITAVPLLDMLRYHKLLAGASWMAEYGNPDIAEQRAYIEAYSPYQNVHAETQYPEIFFYTSTKDDRVHPGHARKMVAKMMDQGHSVLYFENTEGGHAAAANQMQRARSAALQTIYLMQKLMDN